MKLSNEPIFRDFVEKLDNQLNDLDNELDHIKLIAPDDLPRAQEQADVIKADLLWLKQTILNKKD